MNAELKDIKELVRFTQQLQAEIEQDETKLQAKKDRLELFMTDLIPDFILGMGLSEVKLDTGETISVGTKYFGNISKDRAEAAFKWLREHEHGSLIKTSVSATFGAGLDEQVDYTLLKQFIEENEIGAEMQDKVHPQTLKSFIKNSMENGVKFPYELFGVYVAKELVVEKPKTK